MPLMPVAEALRQVLSGTTPFDTETVTLEDAFGRVLAAPAEDIRHVRRWGGAVHADVEKPDPRLGQRLDDAARMAGDVGHLGRNGGLAEAAVELLAEARSREGRG